MNKLAIQNTYLSLAIPYRLQDKIIIAVYEIDIFMNNQSPAIVPTISVGTYRVFYE